MFANKSVLKIFTGLFLVSNFVMADYLYQHQEEIVDTEKKICFIGDMGTGKLPQFLVSKALEEENCDQIRTLGDVIYPDGIESIDDENFITRFRNPYQNLIDKKVPMFMVMGNHDHRENIDAWYDIAKTYDNIFYPHSYYTDTYGPLCLISLDTTPLEKWFWSEREEQGKWLEKIYATLGDSCEFTIALGHHPHRSAGSHGDARSVLKKFYKKHIVGRTDVFFAGHEHQLTNEGNEKETLLLISGGGGVKLRKLKKEPKVFGKSAHGYVVATFSRNEEDKVVMDFSFKEVKGTSLLEYQVETLYSGSKVGNGIR